MDTIKQIVAGFRAQLPAGSKTAAAIDRDAPVEEVTACATAEGLHAFAGALFEACEVAATDGLPDSETRPLERIRGRLAEFRGDLPADSATARAIDAGASLEEISEAASAEGLDSLTALLMESEQEQGGGGR